MKRLKLSKSTGWLRNIVIVDILKVVNIIDFYELIGF